jgi:hypothetical protein
MISRQENFVGPQQELVENRWHSIGDREKESSESIDIRIRDLVNSEILIEVTGCGKVNSHMRIGYSTCRVSAGVILRTPPKFICIINGRIPMIHRKN